VPRASLSALAATGPAEPAPVRTASTLPDSGYAGHALHSRTTGPPSSTIRMPCTPEPRQGPPAAELPPGPAARSKPIVIAGNSLIRICDHLGMHGIHEPPMR
jgi:hypothetical protein